jgi:hypothetical protein
MLMAFNFDNGHSSLQTLNARDQFATSQNHERVHYLSNNGVFLLFVDKWTQSTE